MAGKNQYPSNMDEFDVFAKNQLDYAEANRVRFGLSAEVFTPIKGYYSEYHAALVKSEAPNHGHGDIAARNAARETFEEKLREFNNAHILYNPNVTKEDLVNMGFTPHKPRSKRDKPKTYPNGAAKSGLPCGLSIVLTDSGSGSIALPGDADEGEVYCLFSDTPITEQTDLKFWDIVTSARFEMNFDPAHRGKTVYIAVRWRNNKGSGHWGPIFSGVVA